LRIDFNLTGSTRRKLLLTGIGAAATSAIPTLIPRSWSSAFAAGDALSVDKEATTILIERIFQSSNNDVMKLVEDVYLQCIVQKIHPPDPPLEHKWLAPGGGYLAQWLWDTTFVVDLLSILPGQKKVIREVFENYWDFQRRWNAVKPAFMHGMIANFIAPFDGNQWFPGKQWETFPTFSQAPLLAWGIERVYRRNTDIELVRRALRPLEEFHDWYWRERDVTDCGLVTVGSYSGDVQHARFETYDHEVDLDGLHLTPHPGRQAGPDNGAWYGDILIPANTSYLLLSEASLGRMAEMVGDIDMAKRRRKRFIAGVNAMRTHMWSEKQGCFLAVERNSMTQIESPTVGSFVALMAKVPTDTQAAKMAQSLASPSWATPLPIPTVATTNPNFKSDTFWRGDAWPAPSFQIASGLMSYGLVSAANRIADLWVTNAIKVGISERYDSLSGAPLGVGGLGMSATIVTMMIDGLTGRYQLRCTSSH
jgi:glycogen debranching enzyme